MEVFLCWSGPTSKEIARALHVWLPIIIAPAKVFFSDEDIPAGATWLLKLRAELDQAKFGILCLTPDNVVSPWIHFEAGVIISKVPEGRVVPLLFSLLTEPELPPSLQQFNARPFSKQGMLQVLKSLNASLPPEVRCDEMTLVHRFESFWPEIEANVNDLLSAAETVTPTPTPSPDFDDQTALQEILAMVRSIHHAVSDIDVRTQQTSLQGYLGDMPDALKKRYISFLASILSQPPPRRVSLGDNDAMFNAFLNYYGKGLRIPTSDDKPPSVPPDANTETGTGTGSGTATQ